MTTPTERPLLRLVHIWWPLLLGWSAALVVQRATARPWDPAGLAILLLGIVAAYSLDRVIDPPSHSAAWLRRALVATAIGTALAIAVLLPGLSRETAVLVPVLGGIAALYPVAKRIPLGKTVFVPLIWTWSAIALPFNDGSWFGWHWLREPVAAPLFLLVAAGCLLCDLKDEDQDRHAGVPSLPAVLGRAASSRIAVGLAVAAGAVALAEGRTGVAWSAALLSGAGLWPRVLAIDVVGPLLVDVILTVPGVLILTRAI